MDSIALKQRTAQMPRQRTRDLDLASDSGRSHKQNEISARTRGVSPVRFVGKTMEQSLRSGGTRDFMVSFFFSFFLFRGVHFVVSCKDMFGWLELRVASEARVTMTVIVIQVVLCCGCDSGCGCVLSLRG